MTFREFWPRYLRAHRRTSTRMAHYAAMIVALAGIALAIYYGIPVIALGAIAFSYAIALASHKMLERNRSLVFVNPVWGAVAELKMCWLALTGSLETELDRHAGVPARMRDAGDYFAPNRDTLRRVLAARQQP